MKRCPIDELVMEVAKGNLVDCSDFEGENWTTFYVTPTSRSLTWAGIWEQYTSPILGGGIDVSPIASIKDLRARLEAELAKDPEIHILR